MMEKDTLVKVANRGNGKVFYRLDELQVRRLFQPNEVKEVPFQELKTLQYSRGGEDLLTQYLIIQDKEALEALFGENSVEPEYFYTEEEVKKLLTTGSMEELLDCLDFAPTGVIDNIKQLAVEIKLNDMNKRDAIYKKTGFNVSRAIQINDESKTEDDNVGEEKKQRRVKSNYKVVSK